MTIDFTPIARKIFLPRSYRCDKWEKEAEAVQHAQLVSLLRRGNGCEASRRYELEKIKFNSDIYSQFIRRVPLCDYEDIRKDVVRMIEGEKNILWPGTCRNFAQSSGTSGGRSKFVPVTDDNLYRCHYPGPALLVANYLRHTPDSRLFSGKAMILGGSFANQLDITDNRVKVGDVSATLISRMNPLANLFRVPDKKTALLPDWEQKLPRLVAAASQANVTNISGVPSWFLTVIKKIVETNNVEYITDVWPNLEVFFHGGINFSPYRDEYESLMGGKTINYFESYNASEGFFAVQRDYSERGMLLLLDNDIFYEFIPVTGDADDIVPVGGLEVGKVYEMVITSSNGLRRYRLGDTIRVESINPVMISIAGRTKNYINAFGEELMEENAEKAVSEVCSRLGCRLRDYTVAPLYAAGKNKGRHQWLIEWDLAPDDVEVFAQSLDDELRKVNSDYDAKRSHSIFLDRLEVIEVPHDGFSRWLSSVGSHKLGGQRKVPRLHNDRTIADSVMLVNGIKV